jgi:hypothetical protein
MTTVFGSAIVCSRAAKFGVSRPIVPAPPEADQSRQPTNSVAIPTRVRRLTDLVSRRLTASIAPNPARTARSAISAIRRRTRTIGGDDIQQVLVVQLGSELGRADQVAKQHGQLAVLGAIGGGRKATRQRGGGTAGAA